MPYFGKIAFEDIQFATPGHGNVSGEVFLRRSRVHPDSFIERHAIDAAMIPFRYRSGYLEDVVPAIMGYSAIVYIDGSSVIARGYKGDLIASGTAGEDDATVINNAISSLTDGGLVLLADTSFICKTKISVTDQVILRGMGDKTRLVKAYNGVILELTGTTYEGHVVADLCIDGKRGDGYTGGGILVNGVSRNCLIDNVRIIQCESAGIQVTDSWGVVIKDSVIEYCGNGILKDGTGEMLVVLNVVSRFNDDNAVKLSGGGRHRILFSILEKSQNSYGSGVRIETGDNHLIAGCSFEDFPTSGRCILIGTTDTVNDCCICGNYMSEDNRCIELQKAANTRILYNVFEGTGQAIAIVTTSTSNTKIAFNSLLSSTPFYRIADSELPHFFENIGYVDRNEGSATIANGNSSVTVNHGLAATPSNIQLTGTHSEVKDAYVPESSITDTSFEIHVDSAVTADRIVYWKAKV